MTAAKKKAAAEAALIPESGGSIQMTVDGRKLGLIIGPGGETIKKLQDTTGASLQLPDRKGGEEGERDEGPCTLTISGEKPQIAALKLSLIFAARGTPLPLRAPTSARPRFNANLTSSLSLLVRGALSSKRSRRS